MGTSAAELVLPPQSLGEELFCWEILRKLNPEERKSLREVCHRLMAMVDSQVMSVEFRNAAAADFDDFAFGTAHLLGRASKLWPNLRRLGLDGLQLRDAGTRVLVRAGWKSLEELRLGCNRLGPSAASILSDASHAWPRMRKLSLWMNKLGDEGVAQLMKGHWECLEELDLSRVRHHLFFFAIRLLLSHCQSFSW